MLNKFLVAAAIVIASPTFVSAQQLFWSLDSSALASTGTATIGATGSAFIFSDGLLGFNAIDLDFLVSDPSVILFTGGQAFNPTFNTIGGTRFDSSMLTVDPGSAGGGLFSVNLMQNGVDPSLGPLFDPGFESGVGPNGAVLLARVDYDVVGLGTAELNLVQNPGDFVGGGPDFAPFTVGTATITAVPEPSSALVLVFGFLGMVARRKRMLRS